jgi:hypothetical protein
MKATIMGIDIQIDCMFVLMLALIPTLLLFVLEIIWNLIENVGGISPLLWGVKLVILAFAGFLFVMWRDIPWVAAAMEALGADQ